ncbi:MAG: calcium/sodium antiporter [Gammaproteobacteria bacterium]|nr:calcium/sodium antiporter [Gammaproteobacteria bacterium]
MEVIPFELYLIPALLAPVFLAWGADRFVDGASALSFNVGMSPLLIGVLVMGFGTSLPELLVSLFSSIMGNSGLSLGNAYGSNIVNIGLVLGLAAVLSPVIVKRHVVRRELPLLILATAITAYFVMDYELSRGEGLILLASFLVLLIYLVRASSDDPTKREDSSLQRRLEKRTISLGKSINYLVIGLAVISICSVALVWSARGIVTNLGISELVVGVVLLAFGTSLPELVVIVVAAKRGEHELALGNVIGSNLFNTLAVVGTAGLIAPTVFDAELVTRDLAVMFTFTAALVVMAYGWGRRTGVINKLEGGVLLLAVAGYFTYLVYSTAIFA